MKIITFHSFPPHSLSRKATVPWSPSKRVFSNRRTLFYFFTSEMWFSWISLFYLNCIPYSLQLQAISSHFYRWGNWDWIDESTRSYAAQKWCTKFCAQDPQVQSYFALDQSGDSQKVETTPVISMEKICVTFTSVKKTENSERWTLLPVSPGLWRWWLEPWAPYWTLRLS